MRQTLIFTLLALAIATVVTALFAVTPNKTNEKPVLIPVTTSVEGFQCAACAAKLQTYLGKQKGVSDVKATVKPAQVTAMLDEKVMPAGKFVAAINGQKNAHGKLYTASFITYIDAEMCKGQQKMCEGCFTEIPKVLKGVTDVTLDETGRIATIKLDPKVEVTTTVIAGALKKSKFNFIVSFTDPKPEKSASTGDTENGSGCGMGSGGSCPMNGESGGGCPMMSGN